MGQWKPSLVEEICQLSPEIQLITDPSADPDKAVSFSDNAVPGCLYISVRRGNGLLNPYEIADSIIHEHRHQRLYLFQDQHPIIAIDAPFVTSPWRADPRPPSGLFHAVYVFTELLHWWQHVSEEAEPAIAEYAAEEVVRVRERLRQAFPTLRQTALTATGRHLLDVLEGKLQGF